MIEFLVNCITWIFNFLLVLVGGALDLILSFLPNSPFSNIALYAERSGLSEFFGYLAWIVPIREIINITTLWVGCIAIYYIYSIIMRWVKMVD